MWWTWPHLRRLWAGVGTLIAGLTVTYVYNLWSRQTVPDLRSVFGLIHDYWVWAGSALLALLAVSLVAERAHRKHEARAPRPLRVAKRSWRERFQRQASSAKSSVPPASTIVGRATELAKLNDWFAEVKTGSRQVIFISGEPGIGKTTLTRIFIDSLGNARSVRIGRGQCVEQYGAGEPYMPILEALTRLCREPGGEKLVEILHRMAPAWLAQMPSLVSAEDRVRLQGLAQGTTQQRMLREMAEALEVIAADSLLVLFIEDLHWSDPSTLDLIATVARRSEPARLMILGTYRPVEMLAGEHPLRAMKEELELHQQAIELRLPLLSEEDVATYLAQRLDDKKSLASSIYHRTEGNPLFVVNVVDYLIEQGSFYGADKIEAPRNIRQMIERNLQRLSPDERRILEAASVAGAEFSAAAVAAALERQPLEIEACCTSLVQREQFVRSSGRNNWPDGTVASSFQFHHALYRETLYAGLPAGHTVELHRRIAERLESAYDGRLSEIAAELADHCRRANEVDRAVRYLQLAGDRAVERRAYREAERHYRDAIEMLIAQPESPERGGLELKLQLALGSVLVATRGWSGEETGAAYTRARSLAERAGGAEAFEVFSGLCSLATGRSELRPALTLADQALEIAHRIESRQALSTAHFSQALVRFYLGDLKAAQQHWLSTTASYVAEDFRGIPFDPGQSTLSWIPFVAWFLGYPSQALRHRLDGYEAAQRQDAPFALAYAAVMVAALHTATKDSPDSYSYAERAAELGQKLGFPHLAGFAKVYGSWARAFSGDIDGAADVTRAALAELQAVGSYLGTSYMLTLMADIEALSGEINAALVTIDQALGANPDELWYRPLTLTLRGELRLRKDQKDIELAEQDFRDAIELSRKMSAKSPELRATTSLARLLRDTGRRDEARVMLAEIYGWFTEGFDTRDLKEAKALLDELTDVSGPA